MKHMGPMTPMTGDTARRLYESVTRKEFNTIFIVQGNLDNERVRQLPENIEGCILVTGNVNISECNVSCGMIVLGDCMMNHVAVEGNLTAYGNFKSDSLLVKGELCTQTDAETTGRTLVVRRSYC